MVQAEAWTPRELQCSVCCVQGVSTAPAVSSCCGCLPVFGSLFTSILGSNSLVLRTQRRVVDQPVLPQMMVRGVVFTVTMAAAAAAASHSCPTDESNPALCSYKQQGMNRQPARFCTCIDRCVASLALSEP